MYISHPQVSPFVFSLKFSVSRTFPGINTEIKLSGSYVNGTVITLGIGKTMEVGLLENAASTSLRSM